MSEVSSTDLARLFATDPLELSDIDIEAIVGEMRAKRSQFNMGAARAGVVKAPTAKQKENDELVKSLGLNLGDLLK